MATVEEMVIRLSVLGRGDVEREFASIATSIDSINTRLASIESTARGVTLGVTALFAGMAIDMVQRIGEATVGVGVAYDAMMEQAHIAFTTMMGDAQRAGQFITDLQNLANETHLQFPGLRDNAQLIMAMGIQSQQVLPLLRDLADAAGALGGDLQMRMQRISLAIGEMFTRGTVSAREMNQLARDGIPAWEALAEATGKSLAQVREAVQKREISGDVGINAVTAYIEKHFQGLAEQQAHTYSGLLSTFNDQIRQIAGTMMAPVETGLRDLLERIDAELRDKGGTIRSWSVQMASDIGSAIQTAKGFFAQIGAVGDTHGLSLLDATLATISMRLQENFGPGAASTFGRITQDIGDLAEQAGHLARAAGDLWTRLEPVRESLGQLLGLIDSHKEVITGFVAGFLALQALQTVVPVLLRVAEAVEAIYAAFVVGGGVAGITSLVTLMGGPLALALVGTAAALGAFTAAWIGDWGNIREVTEIEVQNILRAMEQAKQSAAAFVDFSPLTDPSKHGPEVDVQNAGLAAQGTLLGDLRQKVTELTASMVESTGGTERWQTAFRNAAQQVAESMPYFGGLITVLIAIKQHFDETGAEAERMATRIKQAARDAADEQLRISGILAQQRPYLEQQFGGAAGLAGATLQFDLSGSANGEQAKQLGQNIQQSLGDIFTQASRANVAGWEGVYQQALAAQKQYLTTGSLEAQSQMLQFAQWAEGQTAAARASAAEAARLSLGPSRVTGAGGDPVPPKGRGARDRAPAETAIEGFMRQLQAATTDMDDRFSQVSAKAGAALNEAFATNSGPAGAAAARTLDAVINKLRETGIPNWRAIGDDLAGTFHDALLSRLESTKQAALDKLQEVDELITAKSRLTLPNFDEAFAAERSKANIGTQGAQLMDDLDVAMSKGGVQVIQRMANVAQSIVAQLFNQAPPETAAAWATEFMDRLRTVVASGSDQAREALRSFLEYLNQAGPLEVLGEKVAKTVNVAIQKAADQIEDLKEHAQQVADQLTQALDTQLEMRGIAKSMRQDETDFTQSMQQRFAKAEEVTRTEEQRDQLRRRFTEEDEQRQLQRAQQLADIHEKGVKAVHPEFLGSAGIGISGSVESELDKLRHRWAEEDARTNLKHQQELADIDTRVKREDDLADRRIANERRIAEVRQIYADVVEVQQDQRDLNRLARELLARGPMDPTMTGWLQQEQSRIDQMAAAAGGRVQNLFDQTSAAGQSTGQVERLGASLDAVKGRAPDIYAAGPFGTELHTRIDAINEQLAGTMAAETQKVEDMRTKFEAMDRYVSHMAETLTGQSGGGTGPSPLLGPGGILRNTLPLTGGGGGSGDAGGGRGLTVIYNQNAPMIGIPGGIDAVVNQYLAPALARNLDTGTLTHGGALA